MPITKPHVVILASPGLGLLIPILELGRRLAQLNLQVTVFAAATDSSDRISQQIDSQDTDLVEVVVLPPVEISGLVPPNAILPAKILAIMHESLPLLRSAFSAMTTCPKALIVDVFGIDALAIANEFEMLKYVFVASNARLFSISVYAAEVDREVLEEHVNQQQPLKIPGCSPLRFEDTLEPLKDPNGPAFHGFVGLAMAAATSDGVLINTWEDLEPTTLRALRDSKLLGGTFKAPIYPIGPVSRPTGSSISENRILKWLDDQPTESVIYVSFGSGGTLSAKQTIELAWGLELSQQRFIWVIRPPSESDASGLFFSSGKKSSSFQDYLPEGFLTRTQKVGLVVPMWAPQSEILEHSSVGGFLSHCGWNSVVESITNEVAIIGWPLYAEQKMNATMLTEEMGVAVKSKELACQSIVGREEIERMVRKVLVDKESHGLKKKVKELKFSGEKALSNGGSSYDSLSKVAGRVSGRNE
ncbi:UDP-glycosyltransferase 72E1-like [Mangifera indica]|uniref:UDP-glycosyltransferase 72E1-like n=1 Tax=Mangifera indica TaxID=29780 RepID=UPI001CFA2633|nr:UDP-glycosyltransferase 72E1-like [Mangifera indica]